MRHEVRIARRAGALAALVALSAVACTGGDAPSERGRRGASDVPAIHSGGTLRVVMPVGENPLSTSKILSDERPPDVLDPHKDVSLYDSGELWRCCLTRTLLSHNGRSTEQGGSTLYPDLASALPEVDPDGLKWTFELKKGLRYAPPLENIEITAQDFIRSFHRLLAPAIASPWTYLYLDIEGAAAYAGGDAPSISGLEAPDNHTLVIRLTRPTGDLATRLALPATAPIPPHPVDTDAPFGVAQGHNDGFGPWLVSSGPYMLEGSESLDFSVRPADQNPVRGFVPGDSITLVRNPAWVPGTDALRPAYADRIEIEIGGPVEKALEEIDAASADLVWSIPNKPPTIPPKRADKYRPGHLHVDDFDVVQGIAMNLGTAPFDDVHVRKALNYAIDKRRIIEKVGGPLAVDAAGHLAPDSLEDNLLLNYDPYGTPDDGGNIATARNEMVRSRYDSDGDGRCDDPACRQVRAIVRDQDRVVAPTIRENLRAIGLDIKIEIITSSEAAFAAWFDPRAKIPMFIGLAFGKNQISASSFFVDQFYSPVAVGEDFGSGTLVGATREQLNRWGYQGVNVPNIDDRIEGCLPLLGGAEFECWAAIDQYLMQEVVPWVPLLAYRGVAVTSERVTTYSFDQLATAPALDQIAVRP